MEVFDGNTAADPSTVGKQIDKIRHRFGLKREELLTATDGLYVVRTSLPTGELTADDIVERYKDLSAVENAFRSIKTVDLKVRPINHYNADRVRSHIFLCMLAYHVEWRVSGINEKQERLLEELELFQDWTERYEYVIGLGKGSIRCPRDLIEEGQTFEIRFSTSGCLIRSG